MTSLPLSAARASSANDAIGHVHKNANGILEILLT